MERGDVYILYTWVGTDTYKNVIVYDVPRIKGKEDITLNYVERYRFRKVSEGTITKDIVDRFVVMYIDDGNSYLYIRPREFELAMERGEIVKL